MKTYLSTMPRVTAPVVLIAAAALAFPPCPAQAAGYVGTVIASGLDNPRGLAFGPDGALYVTEGGTFNTGGPTGVGGEGEAAYGESGAITRIEGGVQTRVLTGLPSFVNVVTGSAQGPQDIAFHNGVGYFLVGLGGDPALRYTDLGSAGGAAGLASLYSFSGTTVTKVADLGTYEQSVNPAGDQIDSNPFRLVSGPNGLLVSDAGGNALLNVTTGGQISAIATFGNLKLAPDVDYVPTGITVGPDGAFYLGNLTGFPFEPGAAEIMRIDPLTGELTVHGSGFTNITDLAWGADGSLYALQFADDGILSGGTGSIQKLNADGTHSLVFGGLVAPTGLEIGADGAFYVTTFSPVPGAGQVVRIAAETAGAVPEPASWALLVTGFGALGATLRRRKLEIAFS